MTVSFVCADSGSGIVICSDPALLTIEGTGQVVAGTATDVTGKSATVSTTVNLDKTAPAIVATVTPEANAAGWHDGDVTVTFTCTDAGSGIADCPAPVTVNTEGADQVVNGTATDIAGNNAATSVTLNIDKTVPVVQITAPLDGAVVNDALVTVTGLVSEPDTLANLTVNGNAVVPALDGSFTHALALLEGSNTITITAVDLAGNAGSTAVNITLALNQPPAIISIPVTTATENSPYSYDVDATDPDAGDVLTYSLVVSPIGMSIDEVSGLIQWLPITADVGSHNVTVSITDGNGATVTQSYSLSVELVINMLPSIASTPVTLVTVGQEYHYDIAVNDADGDAVSFSALSIPDGMSLDSATGTLIWAPGQAILARTWCQFR